MNSTEKYTNIKNKKYKKYKNIKTGYSKVCMLNYFLGFLH